MNFAGRTPPRLREEEKGATYAVFNPARRPEEYVGQPGPHNGLALTPDVIEAIASSRVSGRPHGYLVQGEWLRRDGVRYLDIAVDRRWVEANSHYRVDEHGQLRWVCPECGLKGGRHSKACGWEL